MAFEHDDLHERFWLRRYPEHVIETKRRVAGGALHVDVVLAGRPSILDFLPAGGTGLIALENRAPGDVVQRADILHFAARILLLAERDQVERTRDSGDAEIATGVILASRVSRWARARIRERAVRRGVRRARGRFPRVYVVCADELAANVKNAPLILYHGNDAAVRRLFWAVDPREVTQDVVQVQTVRRNLIRECLELRGLMMNELKLDILGVLEDIGIKRVVEELGLKRVVEELGLKRVVEELGLKRVIEEVGLPRVVEELGIERVLEEVGARRLIETVGLDQAMQALEAKFGTELVDRSLARIRSEGTARGRRSGSLAAGRPRKERARKGRGKAK